MNNKNLKFNISLNINRWLYLFIAAHLFFWSFVPFLVRDNLPLDSIEGTIWGHQLQWGYDKNPFLNGWLTALATFLGGHSGWLIYFFSQLSVVLCFWAVWQLAKKIVTPIYALVAVMLLELIQYYNFHAIDFNDNTLELGLWGLAIYYFYKACRSNTFLAWFLTGLFVALGMMAKYYTAALIATMLIFYFSQAETRKQLKTLPPYVGVITFIGIVLPHIIWLCFHDFITVTYVFERAKNKPSWTNHFVFPLRFTWELLQAFLPAILLSALFLFGKTSREKPIIINKFDKYFLFLMAFGPYCLTITLSFIFGITLRAGWGMPLLSLWPIILLIYLRPAFSKTKCYVFLATIFTMLFSMLSIYSYSLMASNDPSSANYPGIEIANTIAKQWHDTYHTKLAYVAGSRWVGGNIEFYSSDHPSVFVEWDTRRSPWTNLSDLKKKGAVFVWEITGNEFLPDEIRKQYPRLQKSQILEFSYHRNKYHLDPVKIGIAILPPA